MRSWMIAFSAGVIILQLSGTILPTPFDVICLVILPCLFFSHKGRLLAFLLLGLLWSNDSLNQRYTDLIPRQLEQKLLTFTGYICSSIKGDQHYRQFDFCGRIEPNSKTALEESWGQGHDYKLRLSVYGDLLVPADAARLSVKLKRPNVPVNPAAFDYQKWLFAHGYAAKGYVKLWEPVDEGLQCPWHCAYWKWRNALVERIQQSLEAYPSKGVMLALVSGDKHWIASKQWDLLQAGGIQHLVAISGMHVSMVAGMAFLIVRMLLFFLPLHQHRKNLIQAAVVSVSVIGYAAIAGFPVSCQRAAVMALVVIWAWYLRRRCFSIDSFVLGLFIVLLLEPGQVLTAAFWLSFGAVAVLFLAFNYRVSAQRGVGVVARSQWAVFLGLLPILWVSGMAASLMAPLVNVVAIPVVTVIVLPLVFLGILLGMLSKPLADSALYVCDSVIMMMLNSIEWLRSFLPDILIQPSLSIELTIAALLLTFFLLITLTRLHNLLFISAYALFIFVGQGNNQFSIVVFDTGQGLSVFFRKDAKGLLYDTGPAYGASSLFKRQLAPYIKMQNLSSLDLVVGHGDGDHAGGLFDALSSFDFETVAYPERLSSSIFMHEEYRNLGLQEKLRLDTNVQKRSNCHYINNEIQDFIKLIYEDKTAQKSNDRSCVLLVEIDGIRVLVMGDLEKEGERRLVKMHGAHLNDIDVLIVGHHGSRTSTTPELLAITRPNIAVISAGYLSRYKHPHPDVVRRLEETGAVVLNTAEHGAILFGEGSASSVCYENLCWKGVKSSSSKIWHRI